MHSFSSVVSGFLFDYRFKKSFKTGEIVLLSQLAAKLFLFCHENRFKGWAPFFFLTNIFPLISFKLKRSFLVSTAAWTVFSFSISLNRELVLNLIKEILKEKRLIVYWSILLVLIILLPLKFSKSRLFSSQNSLRKFYHFATVVLFIPAAFWSINVLRIALAVAASLFLCIETVRSDFKEEFKQNCHFQKFNEFMERCRNDLDCGEMILSHFYLLIGCSLPFWLNPKMDISCFSGIISLGIGDSLASIGGKSFGKTTWHSKTSKTLEGSLCGFIGMFTSWILLNYICKSNLSVIKLFFISASSAIFEALITLNDNLTLPLLTFTLIKQAV